MQVWLLFAKCLSKQSLRFYKNILNCIDKLTVLHSYEFKNFARLTPNINETYQKGRKRNLGWPSKGVHLKGSATETKHLISELTHHQKKNKGGEIQI